MREEVIRSNDPQSHTSIRLFHKRQNVRLISACFDLDSLGLLLCNKSMAKPYM